MEILFLVGRVLFSALFLMSGVGHFTQVEQMAQYAKASGVPAPKFAVLGTGVLLLLGGLSILLGFYPTLGLILLIVFLVPTTFIMHRFWDISDPMQRQMQMINFSKNLALVGAALMLLMLKGWPLSLGGW
jgi:putative oxidoreductase